MTIKNKKKLLSIVIKNEHIKMCEVSKNGKNLRVHSAVTIDTPKGAVTDGILEDTKALEEAIKDAVTKNGITTKDIIFSIVSAKIATKEVIIPDVKENKIADIIAANADEYFPVEIDDYIIKYTILERFTENEAVKIRLQLVAAPKNLVENYYTLAKQLGLHIETIDYAGNSIYQMANEQIGKEFCTVINIEGEGTVISIFENNVLKMQRSIPYGRTHLIETVMEKYNLATEAEAKKKLYEEKILNISLDTDEVTDSLAYLVNGIKRITDYYVSRNEGKQFEKAYILGDAVTIPGLVTLVSNEMGMDLLPVIRFENVVCDESIAEKIGSNITEYASSIGALIAPIDIVSVVSEETEKTKEGGFRTYVLILILAAVVSAVFIVMPLMDVWSYEDKIETAQNNIDRLIYVEDVVSKYYISKDKLTDAATFKETTVNNDDYLHIFIDELEKKMPSDIALSGMSVASGSVNVSGTATSKSSVAKFIQELNSIESVANIYVASESEVMDNTGAITVSFTLTCTFGAVTESEDEESTDETADDKTEKDEDETPVGDEAQTTDADTKETTDVNTSETTDAAQNTDTTTEADTATTANGNASETTAAGNQ